MADENLITAAGVDATLKPLAAETDAPSTHKEAPDVWCPCEPHPMSSATQRRAAGGVGEVDRG